MFATLRLGDYLCLTVHAVPEVLTAAAIKLACEGQELLEGGSVREASKHALPRDMVECPDSIDTQDCGAGVCFQRCADCACKRLCACSSAERVLIGIASILEGLCVLLGKSAGDNTPKNVAHDQTSHPPIRFSKGDEPPHADSRQDFRRYVGAG